MLLDFADVVRFIHDSILVVVVPRDQDCLKIRQYAECKLARAELAVTENLIESIFVDCSHQAKNELKHQKDSIYIRLCLEGNGTDYLH